MLVTVRVYIYRIVRSLGCQGNSTHIILYPLLPVAATCSSVVFSSYAIRKERERVEMDDDDDVAFLMLNLSMVLLHTQCENKKPIN